MGATEPGQADKLTLPAKEHLAFSPGPTAPTCAHHSTHTESSDDNRHLGWDDNKRQRLQLLPFWIIKFSSLVFLIVSMLLLKSPPVSGSAQRLDYFASHRVSPHLSLCDRQKSLLIDAPSTDVEAESLEKRYLHAIICRRKGTESLNLSESSEWV